MRAVRVVRDTRQKRADSVQQHGHTLSGRQSFIQMHTVADRLASLSYPENKQKKWKDRIGQRKERQIQAAVQNSAASFCNR